MMSQLVTTNRSAANPDRYEVAGSVHLGQHSHSWSWWNRQQLRRHFALDTETEPIIGPRVPRLAMVSVSDGRQNYVLQPRQLPDFLMQHLPNQYQMICHNVAFDSWAMERDLTDLGAGMALDWLWSAVEEQRVHDTMLLAGLVSLAESDDDRLPSLADAVQQYCGYQLEKDTYRTRYAETIHQDWTKLDPGFFEYVVSDAIATYQLYVQLTREAKHIVEQAGASRQYGFLTEAIQVKAAIWPSPFKLIQSS